MFTKDDLYDEFDAIKPAPLKRYTDIAIAMTGCTEDQADKFVWDWCSDRPKEKLTGEVIDRVLEEKGFVLKKEYND